MIRADPVRQGLLFVGTETGIYFTLDDGQNWMRMQGGLPVVPVYDLKIKDADLIAGTHGRSFWILDDIAPLRALADGNTETRLIPPRETIRTKLHFGSLSGVRAPFRLCDHVRHWRRHRDSRAARRHKATRASSTLARTRRTARSYITGWTKTRPGQCLSLSGKSSGATIITLRSDDEALPAARRPGTRRGLNRFVWDMKHPGPVRMDPSWTFLKNKPLAAEPDAQSGPTVVPGDYRVELTVGSETHAAQFAIVKDPRLSTSSDDYARQYALLKELHDKLSALNARSTASAASTGNFAHWPSSLAISTPTLRQRRSQPVNDLAAIESVLVDVNRESPRDTLRHPAGLNDTLVDLINTVAIADMAPTAPAAAVSREIMAQVDGELAKFSAMVANDIADINRIAAERSVGYVTG